MAYYYEDSQLERATPYQSRGCLSGILIIPFILIVTTLIMVSSLLNFESVDKISAPSKGIGGSPETFVPTYDAYTLTQGPHGYSYGHMAIDIAAGKGATIYSPIHGKVTNLFIDGIGNPTIIIENEIYKVILMHGIYYPKIGDKVKAGQSIGKESNLGNTTDMQGRSCRNRDCGYHTHLNVYDKRLGTNINPLNLLEP